MARKDTYRPVYVPDPLSPRPLYAAPHTGSHCLGQRASPSPYVVTSRFMYDIGAFRWPLRDGEISNGGVAARSNLPPIVPRISAYGLLFSSPRLNHRAVSSMRTLPRGQFYNASRDYAWLLRQFLRKSAADRGRRFFLISLFLDNGWRRERESERRDCGLFK